MNNNPFDAIQSRLNLLEESLTKLEKSFAPNIENVWEDGVDVAFEELGIKTHVILNNLDKIPHAKMFKKLYWNRKLLRDYLKNNAQKVKAFE